MAGLSINRNFFLPQDQALFDYDQIFSVSSMWIELGMENVESTYDLTVRSLPKNRNFMMFGGLEEILLALKNWTFTKDEVDYLLQNKIITPKAAKILAGYKFTGDIWAMPEGTVFFPGEPVVRLTGKIWEINLFTFFLINAVTSNTIFLTKSVRSFLAAKDKIKLVACASTRASSHEASLKYGRAVYILGANNVVPAFARKYGIPLSRSNTKAYHAFIKSFPTEIDAMRAAVSVFPDIGFMVDTYDPKQGVKNLITVSLEQQAKGKPLPSHMVVDSGKTVQDFANQANYARKELDKAGLRGIKIVVTGNFDEYKIDQLVRTKAAVDSVIVATELVTVSDDPKMETVLKLVEYKRGGQTHHAVKLAQGKVSYPGRKQVFRKYRNNKLQADVIGLEKEKLGRPLLRQVMKKGKLVYDLPSLNDLRVYAAQQIKTLPDNLKSITKYQTYPVKVSPKLKGLFEQAKKHHLTKLKA